MWISLVKKLESMLFCVRENIISGDNYPTVPLVTGLTKTWRADGPDDGPERKWPVGVDVCFFRTIVEVSK